LLSITHLTSSYDVTATNAVKVKEQHIEKRPTIARVIAVKSVAVCLNTADHRRTPQISIKLPQIT